MISKRQKRQNLIVLFAIEQSKQRKPTLQIVDNRQLPNLDGRTAYSDNSDSEREILLFISAELLTERWWFPKQWGEKKSVEAIRSNR